MKMNGGTGQGTSRGRRPSPAGRIALVFTALVCLYLVIAWGLFAPRDYYGSITEPRFADPWIERAETILSGGLLYRDVQTMTPPLMNYLLVPPTRVSQLSGHTNPWATLSFMVYFSLFNLFTAWVLLRMGEDRKDGYRAALYFLLSPLTLGNSLLRHQDESVLVFFFALTLLLFLRKQHLSAAFALGAALLVKLSACLVIPIACIGSRNWRYLVIPPVLFVLAFVPFFLLAGEDAVFWDLEQHDTEHPFQFGGISIGALWMRAREEGGPLDRELHSAILNTYSVILVAGAVTAFLLILLKPRGVLEDLSLLTATVLLLSPKLHCGYLAILALTLAPLVRKYRLEVPYFAFAALALIGDFCSFPLRDYERAMWAMAGMSAALLVTIVQMRRGASLEIRASSNRQETAAPSP